MSAALRQRRGDLAAVLLLVLVTTALFADVLFGNQRFFIRDLTRYYFPTKQVIREVILGGEFPYWNPYYSAGQPMAANPEYEIFYLPQLLVLLPDYDLGYRLHILVHFYIAVLGVYLLLRSMGLRIASSMFGAISLGLGGLSMALGNLLPILFCAAWIPWILLFARRFLLRPNRRDFAAAALFLGMQNLVGEPTTMLQTWFLLGSYGLYRAWRESARVRESESATAGWWVALSHSRTLALSAGLVILLVAAGIAVGAAQIIPAFDHVGDSARSRPFPFDLVTAWSMPYARPLELIFPNLFGHIYQRGTWFWGGGLYPGMGSPFLFSIYLGLLPALLLLVAPFARPRGGLLVGWIALVSLVLALGRNTPLYQWLYDAELARSIRYPEKFIFMGLFACALLAATLFDRILGGDIRLLRMLLVAAFGVWLIAMSMAVFSQTETYESTFKRVWGQEKSPNARLLIRLSRADWVVAASRCGAAGLLVLAGWAALRRKGGLPRKGWAALVLAFLVVDVAPSCWNVLPRVNKVFFSPPPLMRGLDLDKRDYRIFHEADWYGTSETARKFFGTGDAVYWIVRNGLFPMTPAAWGFRTVLERDYDKTHLHPTIDLGEAVWKLKGTGRKNWRELVMAMSNARFATEYRDFEKERKRVKGRFKLAQPIELIREADNPRYYFAEQLVTISSMEQFVRKLTRETFPRRVAFVSFPAFASAGGKILDKRERANSVVLDVEAEGRGFLVLSVTPHKYWRAWVDGKPAVLHRANLGYQGVILNGGRHTLTMRYRNPLVLIGMLVTALAVILLALMMLTRRSVAGPGAEPTPPSSAASLLLTSAILIGTRIVHQRFFPRRRWLRAIAAILMVLLGLAAIIPYTFAMSSLIGAELAFSREDWPLVARRFQLYCDWGGNLNPRMRFKWATALMNTGRLEQAASMMDSAIRSGDPNVPLIVATFYLGSIQFQRGQLSEAEATLRSITYDSGNEPLRYYLLGRLAERRNEPAEALYLYNQSLQSDPTFRPSFYHLVRLLVRRGDPQMARQAAQKFAAMNPQVRQDSLYRQILVALNRGLPLEDREFFRLAQ